MILARASAEMRSRLRERSRRGPPRASADRGRGGPGARALTFRRPRGQDGTRRLRRAAAEGPRGCAGEGRELGFGCERQRAAILRPRPAGSARRDVTAKGGARRSPPHAGCGASGGLGRWSGRGGVRRLPPREVGRDRPKGILPRFRYAAESTSLSRHWIKVQGRQGDAIARREGGAERPPERDRAPCRFPNGGEASHAGGSLGGGHGGVISLPEPQGPSRIEPEQRRLGPPGKPDPTFRLWMLLARAGSRRPAARPRRRRGRTIPAVPHRRGTPGSAGPPRPERRGQIGRCRSMGRRHLGQPAPGWAERTGAGEGASLLSPYRRH